MPQTYKKQLKLIQEECSKVIVEESTDTKGKKDWYITGCFMQANKVNRNGRYYPLDVLKDAVDDYIENYVNKGNAIGELDHPDSPTVKLKNASHRIIEMWWVGTDVYAKAIILDEGNGKIVQDLIKKGTTLGVSLRGLGKVQNINGVNYVQDGFVLKCVDIVHDPSAHDAYVQGINESKTTYTIDNDLIIEENDSVNTEITGDDKLYQELIDYISNLKYK